jgi:hypothetical protein
MLQLHFGLCKSQTQINPFFHFLALTHDVRQSCYVDDSMQMGMGISGVAPGPETQNMLLVQLVVLRIFGAAALVGLYYASQVADVWLSNIAGVQLSVIEILIVISTMTQSYRVVRILPFELQNDHEASLRLPYRCQPASYTISEIYYVHHLPRQSGLIIII